MTANDTILVYDPTADCKFEPQRVDAALGDLDGKVVGFIDNGKPNFRFLVDDLSSLLTERYGVREIVRAAKRHPAMGAPRELLDSLADRCDVVITGSGD